MARIAGVNISDHKHIMIALTAIFGIGRSLAHKVCECAGVECAKKAKDLSDAELERLREEVNKYTVEGELRRAEAANLRRLRDINCYRGIRHRRGGLPVRGQRTRTNARTRKGPRRASIALKK